MGVRRIVFVAALAFAAVAPASAEAKLEFNLPASIYLQVDGSGATEADPGRCFVGVFAEFPIIRHAKGYEIVVKRTDQNGARKRRIAPPFETGGYTKRYPPPKGFGRFFLLGYGTGKGCAEAIAQVEGKAVIVSAKVRLDKAYEKRFRKVDKPPFRCAYAPGERTVDLGGPFLGDGRKIIVRKQGIVTTTEKGADEDINVLNNRYAPTGTVVTTKSNSIVKIGALDGGSVVVGPDTTVRLTDRGFEILKQPAHPSWTVKHRPDIDYRVRTCSVISAARG